MAYLPQEPAADLVTRDMLTGTEDRLTNKIDQLAGRIDGLEARIDRLDDRLGRLHTTLIGGFAAMVAALLATGVLN